MDKKPHANDTSAFITEGDVSLPCDCSMPFELMLVSVASIDRSEFIPLREEPFDGARERIQQFVLTLERIVESDNTAVAGIAPHVEQHVAPIESGGIVACHKVPHHHPIALAHHDVLVPLHPSVWWTEKVRMEIDVSLVDIAQIRADAVAQPPDMVKRMVAEPVAAFLHHLEDIGMFPDIVSHHKERGLDAIMVEHIEHPGSHFWNGAIVESEVNGMFLGLDAPKRMRIEPSEKSGRLFDDHE